VRLRHFGDEIPRQLKTGRAFVLDAPTTVPAIWGDGEHVLQAEGESLLIAGPQGVGKTSVMQQLANARMGIGDGKLLGFSVMPCKGKVLYLALDRPKQIARSWRRMVTAADAELLERRLVVWEGPLPFDLIREPLKLAELCQQYEAGHVFVDSIKDVGSPLTDDAVGAAINRAFGACVAAGIEVTANHHNRKATTDNRKPSTLADVYGSVWITAGAGSVISLWGEAGDPICEMSHLKQPVEDVGPLEIEHDHQRGVTTLRERPTVDSLLEDAGTRGITASEAAIAVYGSNPTRSQIEKIRRRLQRLADDGAATPEKGVLRTDPVTYRKVTVKPREGSREGSRSLHAATRTPENIDHASYTQPKSTALPLKGEAVRVGEREAANLTRGQREQLDELLERRRALEPPVVQSEAVIERQCELDDEIAALGGDQ
jgi:replicative DNA helicase